MTPLFVTFVGGSTGRWRVERMSAVRGAPLARADRLEVIEAGAAIISGAWTLRGVTSNDRYLTRAEHDELAARQAPLGRLGARSAALIPVRKSAAWWDLAQDERRAVFEERSHHVAIGTSYLPRIARRLHHSRDLGEPFDFLTWFEYADEDAAAFDELVERLRTTEEWRYIDREIDIRAHLD